MAKVEPLSGATLNVAVNALTEPYWNGTREGKLMAAKCAGCGTFRMPFLPFCPSCNKTQTDWIELAGPAKVYSFCFYPHPERDADEKAMLAPAIVTFDEAPGIRYAGNMAGVETDAIAIGMPVKTSWIYNQEGWGFPVFTPQ